MTTRKVVSTELSQSDAFNFILVQLTLPLCSSINFRPNENKQRRAIFSFEIETKRNKKIWWSKCMQLFYYMNKSFRDEILFSNSFFLYEHHTQSHNNGSTKIPSKTSSHCIAKKLTKEDKGYTKTVFVFVFFSSFSFKMHPCFVSNFILKMKNLFLPFSSSEFLHLFILFFFCCLNGKIFFVGSNEQ